MESLSQLLTKFTNLVLNFRRELAIAFVISAVLITVSPLFSRINTEEVLVAKSDLTAGTLASLDNFELISIPAKFKAPNAISELTLKNQILYGNINKGEQLTNTRLINDNINGKNLIPIRISDPQIVKVISPGQLVDVVASGDTQASARVIAKNVKLVAFFTDNQSFTNSQGVLILVEAKDEEAVSLAGSGNLKLALIIRGQ